MPNISLDFSIWCTTGKIVLCTALWLMAFIKGWNFADAYGRYDACTNMTPKAHRRRLDAEYYTAKKWAVASICLAFFVTFLLFFAFGKGTPPPVYDADTSTPIKFIEQHPDEPTDEELAADAPPSGGTSCFSSV